MPALNDQDFSLIERDTALPGLPCVLDAKRLMQELDPDPGRQTDTSQMGDFQLEYVRYKPGMNCLGRYSFSLDGRQHQVYVKAFGPDAASKLSKARELPVAPGPCGPGRVVLSDTALLVSFFPNDAKLRSMTRLGDRASRQRLMGRIFKHDDSWRSSRYSVLNYKPERRLVCRFERQDGQRSTVKFYTPHGFARTLHLRRRGVFSENLPLPRYLGGSRKHGVHAFEWLPGFPLREHTLNSGSDIALYRDTGKLLAGLHSGDTTGLEHSEPGNLSVIIDALAAQLSFILPEMGNEANMLAKTLVRLSDNLDGEACPVHADFYDKQVIVGPQGLSIIDLDQARIGVAAEDLACFIAHLEQLTIRDARMDASRVSLLSQALLDGYRAAGGHYDKSEVTTRTALALFRLSHNPFRDRALNWPGLTKTTLLRVRRLLAAGNVPAAN